jgi:hypothetical protein
LSEVRNVTPESGRFESPVTPATARAVSRDRTLRRTASRTADPVRTTNAPTGPVHRNASWVSRSPIATTVWVSNQARPTPVIPTERRASSAPVKTSTAIVA